MRRFATLFLAIACCLLGAADGDPIRIHIVSGSGEYKSEASLTAWKTDLEQRFQVATTFCHAKDKTKGAIPGFEGIQDADLLVLYCRRFILADDQLAMLKAYVESKKPIIGIRTASHGFNNFPELDAAIMGGSYKGHGGDEDVVVNVVSANAEHPIVAGLPSTWTRPGKIYNNPANAADVISLLTGTGAKSGNEMPLAWARELDGRRTFYTSIGHTHDFADEKYQALLLNAVQWCLGRELVAK